MRLLLYLRESHLNKNTPKYARNVLRINDKEFREALDYNKSQSDYLKNFIKKNKINHIYIDSNTKRQTIYEYTNKESLEMYPTMIDLPSNTIVEKTDITIIVKSMSIFKGLTKLIISKKTAKKIIGYIIMLIYDLLILYPTIPIRDYYIAKRINKTLKENETGLLIMGALHKVDLFLKKDIQVIKPKRKKLR